MHRVNFCVVEHAQAKPARQRLCNRSTPLCCFTRHLRGKAVENASRLRSSQQFVGATCAPRVPARDQGVFAPTQPDMDFRYPVCYGPPPIAWPQAGRSSRFCRHVSAFDRDPRAVGLWSLRAEDAAQGQVCEINCATSPSAPRKAPCHRANAQAGLREGLARMQSRMVTPSLFRRFRLYVWRARMIRDTSPLVCEETPVGKADLTRMESEIRNGFYDA
jgi:hypothetical protein